MTCEQLKQYLPAYGDIFAVQSYCRSRDGSMETSHGRTSPLLDRLRKKMAERKRKGLVHTSSDALASVKVQKLIGNSNALRDLRRVELGWLDYDNSMKEYKQVRSQNGGGTRHMHVTKDSEMRHILEQGRNLFFPAGMSKKGSVNDFDFEIHDCCDRLPDNCTIAERYDITKVKMLRLYVCSTRRSKHETDEDVPIQKPPQKKKLIIAPHSQVC